MIFSLTKEMKSELNVAEELYQATVAPWFDYIDASLFNFQKDKTYQRMSTLLLVVYELVNLNKEKALQLGNLFKLVYLSHDLHLKIQDSEEGQKHDKNLQLFVLVGDYVFGKTLQLLMEAEAEKMLPYFMHMLCVMNEGMVLEHKLSAEIEEVYKKTRGALYSTIFFSAAQMADYDNTKTEVFNDLGYNLGMGMELAVLQRNEARRYINKSCALLVKLPVPHNEAYHKILRLINELQQIELLVTQVAVI